MPHEPSSFRRPSLCLKVHHFVSRNPSCSGTPISIPNRLDIFSPTTSPSLLFTVIPECSLALLSDCCHQPKLNSHPSIASLNSFGGIHNAPGGKWECPPSQRSDPARKAILLAIVYGSLGRVPRRSVSRYVQIPNTNMVPSMICIVSLDAVFKSSLEEKLYEVPFTRLESR